jgi:hypothetical protein
MSSTQPATSFVVTHVFDLPNRDGLLVSGKATEGKLAAGMVLRDGSGRSMRVLALEFLSPRDVRMGEVTITLERTDPPVRPNAVLRTVPG